MGNKETMAVPWQEAVLVHPWEIPSLLGKQTGTVNTQAIFIAV